MRKVVLELLLAAAALASCAGVASARIFSVSPETGFRVQYSSWEPQFAYGETLIRMRCPVTLEGSFHARTLAKIASSLIGVVTRALVTEASCRNRTGLNEEGELPGLKLRFLAETLPWHLRYGSFTGVLPSIGSVRVTLTGPAIRIYELPIGGSCLYRSLLTSPTRHALARGALGEVTSFTADGSPSLVPFSEGTFICSRELAVASIGTITQLGRASALTLSLI